MDKEVVVLMYNGISLSHEINASSSMMLLGVDLGTTLGRIDPLLPTLRRRSLLPQLGEGSARQNLRFFSSLEWF